MRVLYLNPFSQEVSGPDESLRTLLGGLVPRGLEAHIVLPEPGPQVPRYQALGAQVHFAPLAGLRRSFSLDAALYPARLAQAAVAVAVLARRVQAQLIHTNMEILLEGGIAAGVLGLPHVLHYRGNTFDRPKPVFDTLTAIWTRTAGQVFCISDATAEVFRRRGYQRKVEVLYNPIDLGRFAPAPASSEVRRALGAAPGQPLIGTVGRLHPRKNLETFVHAAARIAANVPEARFAIVGPAEPGLETEYRARIEALVRELALEGRLVFAGARRDMPDVMRALDVFVLTSRHEGFGRVVAEAMGTGRPMVVSDEGAPPELVERGRFGLCAPPEDPAEFATAIVGLVRDPGRAAAMGASAADAARRFDVATVADRVWNRYRELIDARRTRVKRSDAPTARAR